MRKSVFSILQTLVGPNSKPLLRILVGQEYKSWELPLGVREISFFTSSGMTRSKANEVIGVLDAFKKSR